MNLCTWTFTVAWRNE